MIELTVIIALCTFIFAPMLMKIIVPEIALKEYYGLSLKLFVVMLIFIQVLYFVLKMMERL